RGGRERRGGRREIEHRVALHRGALGLETPRPERGVLEHLASLTDQQDRAGEHAGGDGLVHDGRDPLERTSRRARKHHRPAQTTAGSSATSRPRSTSSSTSTPKGSARFSTPVSAGSWPAGRPKPTG